MDRHLFGANALYKHWIVMNFETNAKNVVEIPVYIFGWVLQCRERNG